MARDVLHLVHDPLWPHRDMDDHRGREGHRGIRHQGTLRDLQSPERPAKLQAALDYGHGFGGLDDRSGRIPELLAHPCRGPAGSHAILRRARPGSDDIRRRPDRFPRQRYPHPYPSSLPGPLRLRHRLYPFPCGHGLHHFRAAGPDLCRLQRPGLCLFPRIDDHGIPHTGHQAQGDRHRHVFHGNFHMGRLGYRAPAGWRPTADHRGPSTFPVDMRNVPGNPPDCGVLVVCEGPEAGLLTLTLVQG